MNDFIFREAAKAVLENRYRIRTHLHDLAAAQQLKIAEWEIADLPAADVRPVVRGEWVVSRTDYGWNGAEFPTHCKCTECGREVPYQDKDNFCPRCGADMRPTSMSGANGEGS